MSRFYGLDTNVEIKWRNFYRCPRCGHDWQDSWDSQCDDDCPECGCRHVSPYESEEVDQVVKLHKEDKP